ncbi:hypothetical protein HYN69_12265 [Gemmobacter aquarius]|uniref:Uncharacterized protein n=1 Tax=Paragemmobacter aquarius TaxID=2169400 RepID=A0A2S0UMZ0_9RHOB|nr:hypothetical protein [Gemmobacter aquarius]AWB49176.1 hypothetical protein HYN69_12265 [Gemmobacter aquarius]
MNAEPEDTSTGKPPRVTAKSSRDARLKAALKANMARRKAQARAKGDQGGAVRDGEDKSG